MLSFRSLQAKLFLTYSAVLIVFALLISIPMYMYFKSHITANIKAGVQQVTHGFSDTLDLNFITYENISVQLYNNAIGQSGTPALIDNLETLSQAEPLNMTEQLQIQKSIDNFLLLNTAIYKNIQSISLITANGRVFALSPRSPNPIDPAHSPVLQAAAAALGSSVLVYPAEHDVAAAQAAGGRRSDDTGKAKDDNADSTSELTDVVSAEASDSSAVLPTFSFVRQLNWNARPLGYLEVQVAADKLLDLQKLAGLQGSRALIMHEDHIVYTSTLAREADKNGTTNSASEPSTASGGQAAAADSYYALASRSPSGSDYIRLPGGRGEFAVYQTSARTGYTVLVTVPEANLFAPLRLFRNVTVLSVLLLILFSLAVYYVLARILTHPIKKLKQALDSINIDDQIVPIENKYKMDEIAMLNRSFQKMNVRLKTSLEEVVQFRTLQLQSHFNTLQAQINPHFMFNMLGVITGMSDSGETRRVSEISRKLSRFLRYSITTGSPVATVKDELAFAADYLELMKSRYLHRLSFEIRMDETVGMLPLPKLTIQPLIENCMQHGFHDHDRPLMIVISATAEAGAWEVCIRDSGSGFDAEALRMITGKIDSFMDNLQQRDLEMSFGGMGLVSTIVRLRLLLKEPFVYTIGNNADYGAYIRFGGFIREGSLHGGETG